MKTLEQLGISPAPWHIEKNAGVLCAKSERYKHPIVDDCGNFENNNDKRLIAAAPKLYAACYEMLRYYYEQNTNTTVFNTALELMKQAVAEAAGESEMRQ